jgi:hypothetical protein
LTNDAFIKDINKQTDASKKFDKNIKRFGNHVLENSQKSREQYIKYWNEAPMIELEPISQSNSVRLE